MAIDIVTHRGFSMSWGAAAFTSGHFLLLGTRNNGTGIASEDNASIIMAHAGTMRNLVVYGNTSQTVTVRKALANTALTCSPNNGFAEDLTHAVTFAKRDQIAILITGTSGNVIVTLDFEY